VKNDIHNPWAARYSTWLLIKLTPNDVVISFPNVHHTQCNTHVGQVVEIRHMGVLKYLSKDS